MNITKILALVKCEEYLRRYAAGIVEGACTNKTFRTKLAPFDIRELRELNGNNYTI